MPCCWPSKKARDGGVGAVSVRNCCHTGRIGTYTEMAAQAGLVGIAMTNSGGGGQLVAPFGGTARRLSTNPISIAAPSGGPHPIMLDIASSVAPEGKVRNYFLAGKSVPPGWMIDAAGNPTTNPADFYAEPGGALLPLGGAVGYKGFGLSFMIDILAGALGCRLHSARCRVHGRRHVGHRDRRAAIHAAGRLSTARRRNGRACEELPNGGGIRTNLRARRNRSTRARAAIARRHFDRPGRVGADREGLWSAGCECADDELMILPDVPALTSTLSQGRGEWGYRDRTCNSSSAA